MPEPAGAPVLVAAGGTGGHLFPAEALAAALVQRGSPVHLATDRRAARYGGAFADQAIHVIASETLRARNPVALARTSLALGVGFIQAWALIGRLKPAAVIGFGGYPTIPPLLAAVWRGVPSLIHEANAVIGRANRLLAPRVTAIATTFPDVFRGDPRLDRQGDADRQSGSAGGRRGGGDALSGAGRSAAAVDFRRQPGRADHGRRRPGRDRAARRRSARAARHRAAGARGGSGARAQRLCRALGRGGESRRSSPICRRAWRRAI